ncbi:hypothetical protein TNCV_1483891 [Trichonephila clavipes]|nr:hypothetical protein TNCV_1483891 [Trichonephila clavipes]
MQPKAKTQSSRAGAAKGETRTETVETFELVKVEPKLLKRGKGERRLEPIDENSACVEVGTTSHKHLRRGVNSNNFKNYFSSNDITCEEVKSVESKFSSIIDTSYVRATRELEKKDGTVESTDTIAKLKTKIENSSTFESDPDFVKTLIKNCIDERVSQTKREVTSEQKIELAKLQLAKLEKEIELQLAKNKALSLNPAAKVEEKQFETNIENMIKSLSVPSFLYVSDSPLVSMEKEKGKYRCGQRTVRLAVVACSRKQKHSLRAQAQLSETRTETVETFELVKVEPKLLREEKENERGARAGVTFCISSSNLSVKIATF